MSRIIVTGITTGIQPQASPSQFPQRLEWHDFVQNLDFVTLYVNALGQFMETDQSETASYFQIAGIHGLPYIPWDGVDGENPNTGYCNHGTVTFPTWHRPYVALYEQLLASYLPGIVAAYSQQNAGLGSRLQSAAQVWRLPYWDWAANPKIPNEWSSTTINIYNTSGSITSVTNPLNNYAFHPIDDSFEGTQYTNWPTTLRQPNSSSSRATSNPSAANSRLQRADFKQWVLDLFPPTLWQPDPWGQFSNHTWDQIHPDQGTLTSLESIHDQIHVDVGGRGHMADPGVAAFDPIFWFHHCNVDRILALWQAAYPDTFVSSGPDMAGTFVHQPDSDPSAQDIDQYTPLAPFWKSQSDFATSVDSYSTAAYGYTYPEIAAAGNVSPAQLSQSIFQSVERLYGGGSFFSAFKAPSQDRSSAAVASLTQGLEDTHIFGKVHGSALHFPSHFALFATPPASGNPNPPPASHNPPVNNPHPPPAIINPRAPPAPPQPPTGRPPPPASGHPRAPPAPPPPPMGRPPPPAGSHPRAPPVPPPPPVERSPPLDHHHPRAPPVPPPPPTGRPPPSADSHPRAPPPPPESVAQPSPDDYVVTPETYRDWIANVTLEKYALGGSGRVAFFIGPESQIPSNPEEWFSSPIYVGSYAIFATNPRTTGCSNCKDQAERHIRVGGTVHLTKALIRRHVPLIGDAPINYLTENLHWRCCDAEDHEIPRENVPSLKVVVQSAGYIIPPEGVGARPQRGEWTRHSPITRGRPGGVNHGHEF